VIKLIWKAKLDSPISNAVPRTLAGVLTTPTLGIHNGWALNNLHAVPTYRKLTRQTLSYSFEELLVFGLHDRKVIRKHF
jgi:hypothetical protein